jgi:hypothetical protein
VARIETCTERAAMSNTLFLPRELFEPLMKPQAPAAPARPLQPTQPTAQAVTRPVHWPFMSPARRSTRFDSGEAVAADLLQSLQPDTEPVFAERRLAPRPGHLRGVDLYIA